MTEPVLDTGLSSLAGRGTPPGVDFRTFVYPGVLSMSVLFTAISSEASIARDRAFGFVREMLVAPVSRSASVIGNALAARQFRPSRESSFSRWPAWRMYRTIPF